MKTRSYEDTVWRNALRKGGRPVEIRREVAEALKRRGQNEQKGEKPECTPK